jgi:hypothetical protein
MDNATEIQTADVDVNWVMMVLYVIDVLQTTIISHLANLVVV